MRRKARQAEFGFANWGGKRRGAGRKPSGKVAGVSHAMRERLAARFPVLVTMRLRSGLLSLRAEDTCELLRAAFARASHGRFRVVEYSIQSNHLHLVVEAGDEVALSRGMNGLAVRIARGLNRLWHRVGRVFQDRYHSRALRSPRAVRAALCYVLNNARKHGSWRAHRPDPYSSGTDFDGWRVERASKGAESRGRPGVIGLLPRARTWLLALGWRRHGRLDVLESPGGVPRSSSPRFALATR